MVEAGLNLWSSCLQTLIFLLSPPKCCYYGHSTVPSYIASLEVFVQLIWPFVDWIFCTLIIDMNSLLWEQLMFFPLWRLIFHSIFFSFVVWKPCKLMQSHLSILALSRAFRFVFRNVLPISITWNISSQFSSILFQSMRFHTNLAICVLVYIFIGIWSCLVSFSFIPYSVIMH